MFLYTTNDRYRPARIAGRRSQGFTLIEALVVVAIGGVLLAILCAAIQKVRSVAQRATCANNLHQLALAAHSYQAVFDALPPNYAEDASRTDGSHNLFYGPLVRMLPFLELDETYRNFSFLYYDSPFPEGTPGITWPNVPGGMSWTQHDWTRNPFNKPTAGSSGTGPIPTPDQASCPNPGGKTGVAGQTWGSQGDFRLLSCPSQPCDHFGNGQGTAYVFSLYGVPGIDLPRGNPFAAAIPECADVTPSATNPACNVQVISFSPGSYVIGRSDYVAVIGSFVDGAQTNPVFQPPMSSRYRSLFNWGVLGSLDRIPDGSSNTLLFSEFCGTLSADNPGQPQLNGWISASWTTNGISAVNGVCPDPNNSTASGGKCEFGASSAGLGSGPTLGGWHQGSWNVAFADGSVRALKLSIDQHLLMSLAGYNDGDIVDAGY